MRLWRLTRAAFADLAGEGARQYGGRWNSPGRPMVYAAESAALAVLEVRVHLDLPLDLLPDDYVLLGIEAGNMSVEAGPALTDPGECRRFGDAWLAERRTALLRVPSVIVPESANILVNPHHPEAHRATIASSRPWRFEPRLFRAD